jgi:hypothetical protein
MISTRRAVLAGVGAAVIVGCPTPRVFVPGTSHPELIAHKARRLSIRRRDVVCRYLLRGVGRCCSRPIPCRAVLPRGGSSLQAQGASPA